MKLSKWPALVYLTALLSIAGCSSVQGILGGKDGSSSPGGGNIVDVRGTIAEVNPQSRTLTVTPDSSNQSNLRNSDQRTVFSYNSATVVQYQGQSYQVEDLEVGDRVAARGERQGDVLWARNIDVVASVSGNPSNQRVDLRDFDATVRSVNAGNRTLEVVPFGRDGRPLVIAYDNGTRVEYEGRSYRPEDLEGGDQIHVTTRNNGDRIVAERVVVARNISGNGTPASAAQLHGTVRYIDANARTITLDGVSWAQGFNPGTTGPTTLVAYDSSTIVEYRGRRYSIANLEAGDIVDVDVAAGSGNRQIARRISVAG
jgi:hypothetical protein